ncbi:MAG: LysR family transcriptional regulator [Alphaproteobacteria bacterium]|nr:LysR family transcriptional regulator [Alphaproteobacteria bacterium]
MSADSLNLRHLRVLCAVAEHASISKAASRVHLSQPAITQALAKLERIVGARLFDRSGNGMFLNTPGEIFVFRARRALALIEEGARQAIRAGAKGGTRRYSSFDGGITSAQLRALVAVVEAGNFSLAARAIGISQPSLHRTARDLERLAGVSFFIRANLGIEVTVSARTLARKGRLAFGELEQGFAEIQSWQGRDTGRIVIGTMPLARTTILPRAINELLRARPDVDISVIDGPYDDLLHGLRHGEIDLLTGALRKPIPIGDVVQETLFEDPLVIVGRHGHPLCDRPGLSMSDLARFPWAIPRAGTPTREFFERMFARSGMAPPGHVIEASSLVLIRGLLLGSDRLTLMSAHQMDPEKGPGMLARMPFSLHGTRRKIGVTFRRDWRPTATQTRFLDLLRQEGRAAGGGGEGYSKNE